MMIHVMSSITSSSSLHLKKLSFTKAFAAVSGVPVQSSFATIFATSSLDKNSQIPSDAMTMKESVGLMWNSKISGIGETPTL